MQIENHNIFFKLYQEDEFDSSVGVYLEVTDKKGKVLIPQTFLIGTSDFDREDTKDFYVSSYDNLVYISFKPDSNEILKIYDINSNYLCCEYTPEKSNPNKDYLKRLQTRNKNLKFY